MSEPQRVTVTVSDGVADVRLNRPDKLNALDPDMFKALVETSEELARDAAVRAVVISGEGRGFCSGLDLASFQAMGTEGEATGGGGITRRLPGRITNHFQQAAYAWTELPVPVIAAVHGVALGGGMQLAMAADIRIVAADARLSVLEMRWGLIPDMTGTHMLRRLVGLDVAKELTWTGRMVDGTEAVQLGLATRISDDPVKAALALAAELAGKNPHAIRAAKRLLNQSGLVSQEQQYLDESREMGDLIGSPNQIEAVSAFFEKRDPAFIDPHLGVQ